MAPPNSGPVALKKTYLMQVKHLDRHTLRPMSIRTALEEAYMAQKFNHKGVVSSKLCVIARNKRDSFTIYTYWLNYLNLPKTSGMSI
jgi:hypothetical protein